MHIRQPILAAAALLIGLASAGLPEAAQAQSETEGKTFRWAFQSDVQTLDPHGLFETLTLQFQSNIYEALVTRDRDMAIRPSLAVSWENTQPDTWVFTLREGVTFHNGNPFTADDVLFSLERIRSEGSDMKVIAGLIKEARKLDDHRIALVTPAPDPILPQQLVRLTVHIQH